MWRDFEELTEPETIVAGAGSPLETVLPVQRCRLVAADGPGGGATWDPTGDRCSIGSHPSNDVVIDDRTVSRFHCEISLSEAGASVGDLGSRNGTVLDGVRIERGYLRDGSWLKLGRSRLTFHVVQGKNPLRLSPEDRFGTLVGSSVPMRALFAQMQVAAGSQSTVLIEGETGTGKEEVARSLHQHSERASAPFVVVDCSAISANLLESELFGHERGAFTGATSRRDGAFLRADGGTVFLDEIGELTLALQPKLLRVVEGRRVRRLGGTSDQEIDVRLIAATNRNLRVEVNEGRFRPDLYYRLAVLKLTIPPLRQRPDDIPQLVDHFLARFGVDSESPDRVISPEILARLRYYVWPGNVRELRNYLERCLVLREAPPLSDQPESESHDEASDSQRVDPTVPYAEARQDALEQFERRYLKALLEHHDDNVSKAARAAGMNRAYIYRLLTRHGLR